MAAASVKADAQASLTLEVGPCDPAARYKMTLNAGAGGIPDGNTARLNLDTKGEYRLYQSDGTPADTLSWTVNGSISKEFYIEFIRPEGEQSQSTTYTFLLTYGIDGTQVKADDKKLTVTVNWEGSGCSGDDCRNSGQTGVSPAGPNGFDGAPPLMSGGGDAPMAAFAASAAPADAGGDAKVAATEKWRIESPAGAAGFGRSGGLLVFEGVAGRDLLRLANLTAAFSSDTAALFYSEETAPNPELIGYPVRVKTGLYACEYDYEFAEDADGGYLQAVVIRQYLSNDTDAALPVAAGAVQTRATRIEVRAPEAAGGDWLAGVIETDFVDGVSKLNETLFGTPGLECPDLSGDYAVNLLNENGVTRYLANQYYQENGALMRRQIEYYGSMEAPALKIERLFRTFAWGEEKVREVRGGAVSEWDYLTQPPEGVEATAGYGIGKVGEVRHPDGRRTLYQYDAGNQLETESELRGSQWFVTAYTRSVNTSTRALTTDRVTTVGDTVVSRDRSVSYPRVAGSSAPSQPDQSIRYDENGTAYAASTYYTLFDGRFKVQRRVNPDGTGTKYTYSRSGASETVTIENGQFSNTSFSSLTLGNRTVTVRNLQGETVSSENRFVQNGAAFVTSRISNTAFDEYGRSTATLYLDGTTETRGYGCCGLTFETDRYGVTTTYDYDDAGRLILSERDGISTGYAYDAAGRLVSAVVEGRDGGTITTSQAYDAAGELVSQTDGLGLVTGYATVYERDGGDVTLTRTVANPDGSTRVDTRFNGVSVSESGTAVLADTVYQYGPNWTRVLPQNLTSYSDLLGRNVKSVDAAGGETLTVYNSAGRPVKVVSPAGRTTLYEYDAIGRQVKQAVDMNADGRIDDADLVSETVYAYAGNTLTVTGKLNGSEVGRQVSTLDGLSSSTTDAYGQTTATALQYLPDGTLTRTVTNPDGTRSVTRVENGRTVSTATVYADDTPGPVVLFTYDEFDRQATATETMGETVLNTVVYAYDADGRILSQTVNGQTSGYAYDDIARTVTASLPGGREIVQTYHPYGELKRVEGSDTYPQEYAYAMTADGLTATLTTWQDEATPQLTTWRYDLNGNLTAKEYADGRGPSYAYDPDGLLTARTWARGLVTSYAYDPAGRLTETSYADGVTVPVAVTYDSLGRSATVSDASGVTAFTYGTAAGARNRLTNTSHPHIVGWNTVYTYDIHGRRSGMTVSDGSAAASQVDYTYDPAGRLATLATGGAARHYAYVPGTDRVASTRWSAAGGDFLPQAYSYDAQNRLTGIADAVAYTLNDRDQRTRTTLPDGSYWLYSYDEAGQVAAAQKYDASGLALPALNYTYGYDLIGNRTRAAEGAEPPLAYLANLLNQYTNLGSSVIPLTGSASADATVTVKATVGETSTYYTPERQGEAFAIDIPLPPGTGEVTTDLEINAVRFDSEQDLDLVKTVTGSYTTSSEAMTYDLDGNLLTWDGWTFTWNGENRLVKAEKGLLRVEADYDYLGRRFEKKVYHGETLTSHQRFLYDDYKLIEIRDALNANALETAYVWQPLQLDVPVAMKSGNEWAYYLFDGNKNITSLRAEDGTVLAEYHYGPFGQTLSATGDWANVNPFRFSSEYHDAETGLVYYNYRHYSPELGRWLTRDPIEEQGGVNLYGMVNNNPIKWWDVLGHDEYVPDNTKHGAPHVDRYRNGQNIGRYNKDGSGIAHKGQMPPKISRGDMKAFERAAKKLRFSLFSIFDICDIAAGTVLEIMYIDRRMDEGMSLFEAVDDLYEAYQNDSFELADPQTWDYHHSVTFI